MKIKVGILVAVLLAGISLPAWATIDVHIGDTVKLSGKLYNTTQGPFKMTNMSYGNYFETFCADVSESFSVNSLYTVSGITDHNEVSHYYLTPYAAWIYSKYRTTDWRDDINTSAEYDLVQKAIWAGIVADINNYTLGKKSEYQKYKGVNATINLNSQSYKDLGISLDQFAGSGWYGLGGVRIANLTTIDRHGEIVNCQDQLVLVPEPMSVIVWSLLGLCVYGGVYWRKHRG